MRKRLKLTPSKCLGRGGGSSPMSCCTLQLCLSFLDYRRETFRLILNRFRFFHKLHTLTFLLHVHTPALVFNLCMVPSLPRSTTSIALTAMQTFETRTDTSHFSKVNFIIRLFINILYLSFGKKAHSANSKKKKKKNNTLSKKKTEKKSVKISQQ